MRRGRGGKDGSGKLGAVVAEGLKRVGFEND
jgi:hypothetical protein